MRQCIRCKGVKFWFQFWSEPYGYFTRTTSVCKKCAKHLTSRVIEEFEKVMGVYGSAT